MREVQNHNIKGPERKRFAINPQEFSQERLRIIRETFDQLQRQYPDVLSLSIYGSMSKGYATPDSDVDVIIYLDVRKVKDEQDVEREMEIKNNFQEKLRPMGIGCDCKIYQISEEIINEGLEDAERVRQSLNIDPNSHMLPHLGNQYQPIKDLFTGISVGVGIQKYRRYLLKQLELQGEKGQKIWRGIIDSVRSFERDLPGDDDSFKDLYPYDLQKAMEIYGGTAKRQFID